MKSRVLNVLRMMHKDEAGQGLVEYMLILALVCFGAVAGMTGLAAFINNAFTTIGSAISSAIT